VGQIDYRLSLFYWKLYSLIPWIRPIETVEEISIKAFHFSLMENLKTIVDSLKKEMLRGCLLGLTIGLILGLTVTFTVQEAQKLIGYMLSGGLIGVIAGITIGLIFGSVGGITKIIINSLKADIQTRITPNQGVKSSLKNMYTVSIITISTVVLSQFILTNCFGSNINQLSNGVLLLCVSCLIWYAACEAGGESFIRHFALRLVLWLNGYAPPRYDLLLDYCTERLLLQRIGGRYRFMHRTLQEYFAKMELD
jgi:hypothetical protein